MCLEAVVIIVVTAVTICGLSTLTSAGNNLTFACAHLHGAEGKLIAVVPTQHHLHER